MDNRYWLPLTVVVLLVIAGLVAYSYQNKPNTSMETPGIGGGPGDTNGSPTATASATPSPEESMVSVSYTDNGFNPSTLRIKVGQTVTWVNDDTDLLQVASAPHPEHSDYPPLNDVGMIQPGESKSFTFNEAGSYAYHNHLDPDNFGQVIVEEN